MCAYQKLGERSGKGNHKATVKKLLYKRGPVVQRLGYCTSTAWGLIPGWGTKIPECCMVQPKINKYIKLPATDIRKKKKKNFF